MTTSIVTKISTEIDLFIKELQQKFPDKKIRLEFNTETRFWSIIWNPSDVFYNSVDLEVWSEKEFYSVMCSYGDHDLSEHHYEEIFYDEDMSIEKLNNKLEDLLETFKKTVVEYLEH